MTNNGSAAPVPGRPAQTVEDGRAKGLSNLEMMYNQGTRVHRSQNNNNSPTGLKENNMEKLPQNIQEAFLNAARKERIFLTIYLMSGVKLSGRIRSFDKYSVVLESNNQEQLIFKHAISTVVVARPVHGSAMHGAASAGGAHSMSMAGVESSEV